MTKNYRARKYQSGFERLSRQWTDTNERYMNALLAVKDKFSGFLKKDGYNPSRPDKLSANQKHQIRRYYNLLTEYTEGQPVYIMPPSELPKKIKQGGRKNIEAVMKAAQMHSGRKRAKVIFVKFDGENIPKVGIRNNAPTFINYAMGYEKETIELNQDALADNPRETIMSIAPLVEGASFFRIIAGRHEIGNQKSTGTAGDLEVLARQVIYYQNKYQTGNHAWENWLFGVTAYYGIAPSKLSKYEAQVKSQYKDEIEQEKRRLRKQGKKFSFGDYVLNKNLEIRKRRK